MERRKMTDNNSIKTSTRMVHIRLPLGLHKKVRVRAAEIDKTIQDWVLEAIQNELTNQTQQKRRGGRDSNE